MGRRLFLLFSYAQQKLHCNESQKLPGDYSASYYYEISFIKFIMLIIAMTRCKLYSCKMSESKNDYRNSRKFPLRAFGIPLSGQDNAIQQKGCSCY